ncbi:MAG: hypothetical protein FVQ84_13645 [Planctomycetes bacterium]|nr:hypothetical protein [Planctomycetota bacterium]
MADLNQEMLCREMSEVREQTWISPQVLLVFAAWLFLCWLHWDNNGLWYGDAPRHAANGLFWKDFLLSLSLDPKDYALSYYARYPVIAPTSYPPVFYLLEAIFFGAFVPSPYIAKGLVLGFALMAALYTSAWCRRWISGDAGWAGALLLLLPGVVLWSHAIMLNIPALALSIAALYHVRRWLESPPASPMWRQLYIGAALSVLAILTYMMSGVLVFVILAWIIAKRRWDLLWNRRTLIVVLLSAIALLPWSIVVVKWEMTRVGWAVRNSHDTLRVQNWHWQYYFRRLPELFSPHLLLIAAFGIISGVISKRWRHETIILLIWVCVCFVVFTYVGAREGRYILLLSAPVVCFCIIALLCATHWLGKLMRLQHQLGRLITVAAILMLFASQAWLASRVPIMSIKGIKEVVEFFEKVAPDEPIFYCGKHYANFTFQVQAGDPEYHRRVVLSRKLLYAEGSWNQTHEFISSPQDAVEVLQKQGGCRWLAIMRGADSTRIKASQHLREAVKGPQFELVKSFQIQKTQTTNMEDNIIDVYRFLVPIEQVDEVDMPLFSLGEGARYRVKPIQR